MQHLVRFRLLPMLGLLLAAAIVSGGCKAYQFQLVEPGEFAGPVVTEPVYFHIDPLEYEVVQTHGRLGMRVFNPTEQPVTLLGERSYIVDPRGESRPLRGRTIAPSSRISMLLPPEPTVVRSAGPRFGVGVGVGTGFRRGHIGTGIYGSRWHGYGYPTHIHIHEGDSYWPWTTGLVQMRLMYEQVGETFQHELVFDRVRIR